MRTVREIDYPVFEPNQILSAEDLNGSFNYLQDQELLTRANLIGTGIVSGLKVDFVNNSIIISKGCGVTSDGHYISIDKDLTYSFYSDEVEYKCSGPQDSQDRKSGKAFELFGEYVEGRHNIATKPNF